MSKTPKRPTNLTLDPDAIARGESFGQLHGSSLSKLVSEFLYALPDAKNTVVAEHSPAVERLLSLGIKTKSPREDYREHLLKKYGGKK